MIFPVQLNNHQNSPLSSPHVISSSPQPPFFININIKIINTIIIIIIIISSSSSYNNIVNANKTGGSSSSSVGGNCWKKLANSGENDFVFECTADGNFKVFIMLLLSL